MNEERWNRKNISVSNIMWLLAVLLCTISVVNGSLNERIVGGNDAAEGKYPYVVRIMNKGELVCGGTIINNRYILTGAGCIKPLQSEHVTVVAGTNDLKSGGVTYSAETLYSHPDSNTVNFENDVALIRVAKEIEFGDKIQPIALSSISDIPKGETVTVIGWGKLNNTADYPTKLQELKTMVIEQSSCMLHYKELTVNNVCTSSRPSEGLCFGDASSPLIWNGVQIAIASFGKPCALGFPDVYILVAPYLDWIKTLAEPITTSAGSQVYLNTWIVLSLAILTLVKNINLC